MEVIKGRMYDYNNGRFLSVDPFIQSPTSTQSMNPYTYIFNNPLSGVDPTGYKAKIEKERVTGSHIAQDKRKGPGNRRKPADFKSKVSLKNGGDSTTTRGPQTQSSSQSGGVSGTGGQSARMQEPVVLGEDPETGENLDQRTVRLSNVIDFSFSIAEKITGTKEHATGELVKKASFAGIEVFGGKIVSSFLSKIPGFGWLAGSSTKAGSIRDVNIIRSTQNCVNCSIATDAMLSGSRASALPSSATAIRVLEKFFGVRFSSAISRKGIESNLLKAGDGARGIVYGSRGSQIGHVFNVVNQKGTIRFLDGQIGKTATFDGFKSLHLLRTN